MKLFIQAAIASIAIHVIYFVGILVIGYIKTLNYTPVIEDSWKSVDTLQTEVAFGMTGSPFFFLFTFLGVTVFFEVLITAYRRLRS
ncbi:hypothetical protein G3A_13795 [Bacillus sp. 17376]|uniref:Uncharacterized protein n=1 Tax=Mesobacillus boroniphilus JCM 21738 TaxID=1294265 RepID=W4RN43_9BACI|nr:hypothetical protein [Mesobacillus boroniphilus]ESU31974.1 hypothetical protein G3A_13795 [Bacillus sp. 17376]GAE45542.1 hypothetical protein JCM21738_2360 [Mesobacillus boroniphilus JCM 21738]